MQTTGNHGNMLATNGVLGTGRHTLYRCQVRHWNKRALGECTTQQPLTFNLDHICCLWPSIFNFSPVETSEQVACHEVSQGVGSPSLRGGGASGPGEGGLHRVRAVLREEGASTSLPPLRSLPPVLALLSPAPRGLLTWNLQDALIGGGAQCTQWLVKTVQSAHWALDETGYSNRWHEKVRHPWRLSPDIPTVQLPLARSWAAGGQREGTAQTSSTLHSLRVFTTAIALPCWDCTAWLIAVCLVGLGSRVNYTKYIFRINTECVNEDVHFIVHGGYTL